MSIDEQIIALVQNYQHLYDLSNKYYYDSVMKENVWLEISKNIT